MLIDSIADKRDLWLVYELCPGQTLNEMLFRIKGEFHKGERIYQVHHGELFHALRSNRQLMRDLVRRLAMTLKVISSIGIVHADLKPDNVIVDFQNGQIKSLKIIDFGSSFVLNTGIKQGFFGSSTPEYLPPEAQQYLDKKSTFEIDNLPAHVFDMWSLGSILIEVMSGFPIWLSLKSRVITQDGRSIVNLGLLGVAGRNNHKILARQ